MDGLFSFELLSQQLPLSVILDNIDAGIAVYDATGNYLFVNTALINWRNISRQEFLKMNVHDFVNVLDVCVFDLVFQKKARVSRLQYYHNIKPGDGPAKARIVTGTPIFDGGGNIKYVVTMLQDVQHFEALHHELLAQHKTVLSSETKHVEYVNIVAESPEFSQLLTVAKSIADLDSTVLLYGESGSGKEVIARFIHDNSNRKSKPMITVNCAAFPENLIEAELFGYEKGSFTGASQSGKMGLVEAADGSTLFLDEINSLPASIQGKLLRVIEEKSVQRIGAVKTKTVDFRLVTATNQDLGKLVQRGAFREDLYYRLHVIPLMIPPLRSRRDDIIPLCLYFLHYFCERYHLKKTFSQGVLEEVRAYQWPGNVRELRNFVERMVVMTPYTTEMIYKIPVGMLDGGMAGPNQQEPPELPRVSSGKVNREKIVAALTLYDNHRGRAAEYLGISRRYLQYKIKEYQIPSRCRYETETRCLPPE